MMHALSWCHQVSKVCQSMSYYLHLLNKQKLIFKMDLLKLFIESLVLFYVLCLGSSYVSCLGSSVMLMLIVKTFATLSCSFMHGLLQV